MVSTCLKQIRHKTSATDINIKDYIRNISDNEIFRKEYKNFDGNKCPSQIGRILITLTYYRLYSIVELLALFNPSIHGKRIK